MANDSSGVPSASSGDWQQAWTVGRQLIATHKPLESGTVAIVASAPGHDRTEPSRSVLKTIRARPLSRTLAVWIIVGTLWISLGMIVSATIVTVAFLA